jgi:eukaryotic-like serine/threonine-protein kinase
MSIDQTCPDVGHWQNLMVDSVSVKVHQMLEEHLNACVRCQGLVEGLTVGKPHWAAAMRRLAGVTTTLEPGLDRIMKRLKGDALGLTRQGHEEASGFPVSLLAPPQKPEFLGELSHYSVSEVIGSGGMGTVLKAFDNVLQRHVALKVLAAPFASQKVYRQRFLREARAAAAVAHEHVVTIHAVEDRELYPYLVMHYVRGCSLQERISRDGPLELKEVLRIGRQIALGLAAAHAQGLIHRDVKPANVLLENGVERVKLTDFGLARTVDDAGLTQSGVVSGTPQYMAPEQARGEPLDHRADLFSLGSVLYFACTGKAPFQGHTTIGIVRSVADDAPIPLARLNPDVPPWLVAIIAKLHAKAPADRYQSAAEVADVLGAQLARLQNPVGTKTPVDQTVLDTQPTSPARRERRRHRTFIAAGLLLAVGAIGWAVSESMRLTHTGGYFQTGAGTGNDSPKPPLPSPSPSASEVPPILQADPGAERRSDRPPGDPAVRVTLRDPAGIESGEIGSFSERATRLASVALSADGARALAAGATDTNVLYWDLQTGTIIHRLIGHQSWLRSIEISPDGKLAVTGGGGSWKVIEEQRVGGSDFIVRLWDLETGKTRQSFSGHADAVMGVAFTPDGRHILSCDRDAAVILWSVETGEEVRRYEGHYPDALCVAVSSDGKLVAAGGWNIVLIWDLETGEQLKRLEGHHGNIVAAAFSTDDRFLATGGHDHTIRLYSVESGTELRRFPGHTKEVQAVAFSPDGRLLLSGGKDKLVRLWNVADAAELRSFEGHTQAVNDVAFAAGNHRLAASAGEDGTMRLWLLPAAVSP